MKEIASIRTFEDEGFQRRMVRASMAMVVVGAVLGAAWFLLDIPGRLGLPASEFAAVMIEGEGPHLGFLPPQTRWLGLGAVGCFASLAVHELVHAVFFRAFAPAGTRVTFGANWKAGMLYACAEGIVYTRRQYLVIALAPTVVVTALLLALGTVSGWPLLCYGIAVLHLSGCTGDWGYAEAILRDPRVAFCEDTSWGVRFFADDGSDVDDVMRGKDAR